MAERRRNPRRGKESFMEDQTSGTKRNFANRSMSTSSTESPTTKKPKDNTCEVSDLDESDELFVKLKMTEKLEQKMEQILEKLNKLYAIEEKINKLDNIESKIEYFGRKLTENEKSLAYQRCELDASKEKQVMMQRSLNELKESVGFNDERVDKLEVKSAKEDLARKRKPIPRGIYSRRENLKFAGIPESKELEQKQTKEVLMEFLKTKLGIEQPEDIEFQRIHRTGKVAEPAERPRMIIALFLRYTDREYAKRQAFKLKGTDFTIYDDIPKELVKERKKLMPLLHQVKKTDKKGVFSKAEPDKLYVGGKLISV